MIHIKTAVRVTLGLLLAALVLTSRAQDGPQPRLPTVPLTAGMHVIQAEVARTPEQQMIGMMHRTTMGANEGMLFVYEQPHRLCFWMRNTLIPLSIAYIADDGRIVNIRDMMPLDETRHCADQPVRFALEMNQGWFARRGLKPGARLRGAPFGP